MRQHSVVALEVVIEYGLHHFNGLELGAPPLDPEMLVKHGAMEAFKDTFWIAGA